MSFRPQTRASARAPTTGSTSPSRCGDCPEDRWLFHRLEDGTAGPADARRIADRIAAFHNALDPAPGPWGGEDTIRTNTEENFEQVRPFIGAGISAAEFDSVRAYTRSFLDQRRELFAARVRDGWIRDGHGDLHAAQICLENGISFIDCIEFNERFRIADVAADLAFLAMDLDRYGRPDLRRVLVDTYRRRTGDNGLLDVLDFYMAYRAFTRGKIECLRMDQLGPDEADLAEDDKARAAGYFAPGPPLRSASPGPRGHERPHRDRKEHDRRGGG